MDQSVTQEVDGLIDGKKKKKKKSKQQMKNNKTAWKTKEAPEKIGGLTSRENGKYYCYQTRHKRKPIWNKVYSSG